MVFSFVFKADCCRGFHDGHTNVMKRTDFTRVLPLIPSSEYTYALRRLACEGSCQLWRCLPLDLGAPSESPSYVRNTVHRRHGASGGGLKKYSGAHDWMVSSEKTYSNHFKTTSHHRQLLFCFQFVVWWETDSNHSKTALHHLRLVTE